MKLTILSMFLLVHVLSGQVPAVGERKRPKPPKGKPKPKPKPKRCLNPTGTEGDSYTDGCLKKTCKRGVWITSLAETLCCHEGKAYNPDTTIMVTTAEDDCTTTSVECRTIEKKAKLVFQVENNCSIPWKDLEGKMDLLGGQLDVVDGKVDALNLLIKQQNAGPDTILTNFVINEGNETFVQENYFQSVTEILVLKVPPHKNYTDSVFMFHQKSNTSLLKTGQTCQLTDLPVHVDVSAVAEEFETGKESTKATTFVLKSRESRFGSRKRKELLVEAQDLCENVPLVKTNDYEVNQTEFEKYNRGEVIFLKNSRSTRLCKTFTSCSKKGPHACGYGGWTNPAGGGFSFHQVSSGSVCVACYIFKNIPGTPGCNNALCLCADITDKAKLLACSIQSGLNTTIELHGFRKNLVQVMLYDKSQVSLAISSPAHRDLGPIETVMHGHKDGWWHAGTYKGDLQNNMLVKLGVDCFISTIPNHVFPVDIAMGIQEIKAGNDVTTEEDEMEKHGILLDDGPLTEDEENNLHLAITSRCSGKTLKKFVETPITKSQSEDLKKGKFIFIKSKSSRGNCEIQTLARMKNSGSLRIPNEDNDAKLWVNQKTYSVTHVKCCKNTLPAVFPNCCKDFYPEYKQCSELQKRALFVATGVDSAITSSVEILTEDEDRNYTSKQVEVGGCSWVNDFPFATSSATGALFNDLPHICAGYKEGNPSSECFEFKPDGSWGHKFDLQKPLKQWGSSVTFADWNGVDGPWWIVGGEPDGNGTEVWGGYPPTEISNGTIKLPKIINQPCMTIISDHEAFVSAILKFEEATSNFAWIFNIQSNTWTRLNNTLEKRSGAACGFLNAGPSARFIVLAGGLGSQTTEILDLDTLTWSFGPSIGVDLYGGSMVSVSEDKELLLVGGYNTDDKALPYIRRMNSSMNTWDIVGELKDARFNAVALAVPVLNLPPLCQN